MDEGALVKTSSLHVEDCFTLSVFYSRKLDGLKSSSRLFNLISYFGFLNFKMDFVSL
jgi:hypothetical protein